MINQEEDAQNRIKAKHLRNLAKSIDPDVRDNNYWCALPYYMSVEDLGNHSVDSYRHLSEAEHQIGRFQNMKDIFEDMRRSNIYGDMIEFGCWQGLSLIWLARFRQFYGFSKVKIVGVDSFEGLPESSTIWKKGLFHNTTLNTLSRNLKEHLSGEQQDNIYVFQGWFSDDKVKRQILEVVDQPVLFHLDADLGSSTKTALDIITPFVEKNRVSYVLFDDWGCHPDEVPNAFFDWIKPKKQLDEIIMNTTKLTRYYKVINHSPRGVTS